MTKLIIQIPCLNEEQTLPVTLKEIPTKIQGIDTIEFLVINDGSTDRTVEVARKHGVHHIINFNHNQGLAKAFMAGLVESAKLGADYVVNLDADNQYCAQDIEKLLAPLMGREADIVVGERPVAEIETFSWTKKRLQTFGSWVVRKLTGTDVKDIPSGFRAYNRKAMLSLHIFSLFTYTHEAVIAASELDLKVVGVPIRVNQPVHRPSRLMKSTLQYVTRSAGTILRLFLIYNPYPIFVSLSVLSGICGALLLLRFIVHYLHGGGAGLIQSLIFAAILMTLSMVSFMVAVLSDLLRINRKLVERLLNEVREIHYRKDGP